MMKRRSAVQKTGPSDTKSRTRDFSLMGRKKHQQQRDLQLNWLFLGLLILFNPFLRFNSSNNSHFSTARAETSSQEDSLCRTTFVSTVSQQGTGSPTAQRERPLKVNDKYTGCLTCVVEKSKTECGIKHSLKRHYSKWEEIGAFQYILKIVHSGYEIPFVSIPPSMNFRNNKSAQINADFVTSEISQLIKAGCVVEVTNKPYIVSPLSVAENRSKKRLILDLSRLNNYVRYEKIKFEDWKTAIDYFEKDCYCLKFDLKSGYHHIDISDSFQTYLGFSWNDKFYCYTVLPFGLSSAPFIFTKCLRPIVKFWRKRGIKIVLYLDDGFVFASSKHECLSVSEFIKSSLSEFGLLINIEKSVFYPTQNLEWLGILWDSKSFSILVPKRRLDDTVASLQQLMKCFPKVTARQLARVVGKIMSMSPVMDIFKTGRWSDSVRIEDQRLQQLRDLLPTFCLKSRAGNTSSQYRKIKKI
ncbi:uncharacterized protein LOC125680870 isoform X2 [Ostrea edulis]|uniref:uncharacterized protein LOC125680870 isoform X2 n=1 Tax=Ostrea edulis TaxID=37623 RepID=UPI0024AFBD58|nr:uncharacterized protein LOC125680870 isoform X2 [Ostrea edulis]